MNVLSIGSDRNIFNENSGVRKRVLEYGALVEQLHIVVFCKKTRLYEKQKIGKNVWAYPTNSKSKWGYVFDAVKIGKKIVRAGGTWLVTAQDPFESGLAGWCVARATGARLQLQIHTDFLSPYFTKGSMLNKFRVRIAMFLLPRADCVRVVSKRILDSIKKRKLTLKRTPDVLPIFIHQENILNTRVDTDLHKKYPEFDTIILMVSRLEREKNITRALAAFAKITREFPRTGLVIVGDGSERKHLEKQAAALGISESVFFEGERDSSAYYKSVDIFLHTSNYEGYGLALAEAALAGCPIVTTDVGIANDFFKNGESAFVCPVGDDECLAKGIAALASDKNLRATFAEAAKKSVLTHLEKDKDTYLETYGTLWERCRA